MADTSSGTALITYQDCLRTGPGTLAGRYLRLFWQPVRAARDLPAGRAIPIRIMSEDLTLYRGETGQPHLVAFRCAHRGTQLSTGWVEGDDLRCFYHGWKYGPDGQCVEQPAEPEPFCQRIRIRSYPVREYLGMIFAYLGDGEAPDFPRLLDFEETPYPCEISYMEWPCNYFTQLDNAVDPAHVSIAHWHFRTPLPSRVVARENECGLIITADGQGRKKTPSYVHMPNAHEWGGPPRGGKSVWNYARGWRVPLDDYHHARFGIEAVAASKEEARERWVERTGEGTAPEEVAEEVLAGRMSPKDLDVEQQSGPSMTNIQDYIALVGLGPIADQPPVEHLGRADVAVVALRNLFVRELRALAEGRPLMEWKRPERLWKEVEAAAVLEGSSSASTP